LFRRKNVMRINRTWAPILVVGLAFGCTGSGSSEEDVVESGTPGAKEEVVETGTFSLEIVRVSFVGSAAHGSGQLNYGGKTYKFKVNGLGAGGFGASKATLRGTAYNLNKREDFAGTYVNVRSGVAAGEADIAKSIYVKNENGVELKGKPDIDGVQLNLGVDGVVISWDD
jgi:hypothetical protein